MYIQWVHISIELTPGKKEKEFTFDVDPALLFCVNIFYNNKCQCLYPSNQPMTPLSFHMFPI